MDKKELQEVATEAKRLLAYLDGGKTYTASYLVSRLEKVADAYPSDQLIGNMKEVLKKRAVVQDLFSQKEITGLYNEMYGLSGGRTAFKEVLGDLLTEDFQIKEAIHKPAKNRTMEENSVAPLHQDNQLAKTYAAAFSVGQNNSFSTYQPGQDQSIQQSVIAKLSSLGYTPVSVKMSERNEHFALCLAYYDTPSFNKVSVKIPVQISLGYTQEPEVLIDGDKTVSLTADNLYLNIKAQEKEAKDRSKNQITGLRSDGTKPLDVKPVSIPKALEAFADLEDTLVAALSKIDNNQIQMAKNLVASELMSFGSHQPDIKIAQSDTNGLIFNVFIPTKLGKTVIQVPVEIINGKPTMPSRFAANVKDNTINNFDFSVAGYQDFISNINSQDHGFKIARDTGELTKMSYHQLVDQMIDGVASQDYKLSEDALAVIESRFGSEQFKIALDYFTQLLKHASTNSSKRKDFIEAAVKRGELITIPTTVELYSPKLGLPLSKISFDEKGRLIAKGRRNKSDNSVDSMISPNQILLS